MTTPLDALFPVPSGSVGKLVPRGILGGATAEAIRAVTGSLKDDYEKSHVFVNDKGFHNHTAHYVLALYGLGANEELIRSMYAYETAKQRKVISPPMPITNENLVEHLGDENFYISYLAFFSEAVLEHGASKAIEKYIFADEVNTPSTRLICRFMSGVLHPFIHTGYGFEFNLPGFVAEGLAQTYVHPAQDAELFAPSLYQAPPAGSRISSILPPALSKIALNAGDATSGGGTAKIHALSILHKLHRLRLPFDNPYKTEDSPFAPFESVPETVAKVQELAEQWFSNLALNSSDDVEDAIEQLVWTAVLVYGVGSWGTGNFKADLFFVHLLTSSLFLPSIAQGLSLTSQRKLLGAYFTSLLSIYVWRFSPALNFKPFFEASLIPAHPDGMQLSEAHPCALKVGPQGSNPWLSAINNAMRHPEGHVAKAIRALEHWASLYGATPRGKFTKEEIGWEDAEQINGTLFLRTALLTMEALGRVADGEKEKEWYHEMYTYHY